MLYCNNSLSESHDFTIVHPSPIHCTWECHSPDLVVLWHTSDDLVCELQLFLKVLLQ